MSNLTYDQVLIYRAGLIEGVRLHAWWKDGAQYVGTCGRTLEEAIADTKNGKYDGSAPTLRTMGGESL